MKVSNFEKFVESVSNLAKVRKWDTYDFSDRRKKDQRQVSDLYFTYNLKKDELGKYLNTWFTGVVMKSKTKDRKTYRDEMITLKKVDKETAQHLYNREFNPVSVDIMCPTGAKFKQDENGNDLYIMKAQIHSIDDSSYGIWWDDHYGTGYTIEELMEIREEIMKWVNSKPILNGEEFLDYCVSLGALEETKDYN
jgi:hypothetical protein